MNDEYFDVKGIRHRSQHEAECANEDYLRDERIAREKATEALEGTRREATRQREAVERAAREAEEQRQRQASAQLAELRRQDREARKYLDYEKQVLFLKESDEATRLDTFLERLLGGLNPEDCQGESAEEMAKVEMNVAQFYHSPPVPDECKLLAIKIKRLVSSKPTSTHAILPEEALALQAEVGRLKGELRRLEGDIKGKKTLGFGCLGLLGFIGLLCLFVGVLSFFDPAGFDMKADTPPEQKVIISAVVSLMGLVPTLIFLVGLVRHIKNRFRKKPLKSLLEEQAAITNKHNVAERQLQPFLSKAQSTVQRDYNECLKRTVDDWILTYRNALVKSFFDQGLWLNEQFPSRLKAALVEIQKPFPTSCRSDVNKLRPEQIQSAYNSLTAHLGGVFALKQLSRTKSKYLDTPLKQSLVSEYDVRHMSSDEMTLAALLYKQGKGPDPTETIMRNHEVEARRDAFLETLAQKQVLLDDEADCEECRRQRKIIHDMLLAGPSALAGGSVQC